MGPRRHANPSRGTCCRWHPPCRCRSGAPHCAGPGRPAWQQHVRHPAGSTDRGSGGPHRPPPGGCGSILEPQQQPRDSGQGGCCSALSDPAAGEREGRTSVAAGGERCWLRACIPAVRSEPADRVCSSIAPDLLTKAHPSLPSPRSTPPCQQDGLRYGERLHWVQSRWLGCTAGAARLVPVAARGPGAMHRQQIAATAPMPCHHCCSQPPTPAGKFFLVQFPQFSTLLLPLEPLIRLCESRRVRIARVRACLPAKAVLSVCGSSTPASVPHVHDTACSMWVGCQIRECMQVANRTVQRLRCLHLLQTSPCPSPAWWCSLRSTW